MATRRPKVPRADALGRPVEKNSDGGHVIRADFGDSRKATGEHVSPGRDSKRESAARETAAPKAAAGKAASSKTHAARAHTARAHTAPSQKPGSGSDAKGSQPAPVPARAFSGRMLALAVVMIAITLLLAPTVKIYLEKKAEISSLQADIASKQAEQADLKKQITRWQDPNYVKQQARDRINMVMPGEAGYWVFGGDVPAGTPGGRTGSGISDSPGNLPWVDGLWESIKRSATD
ncbi:septum formation initiator family protein [bacterium RCC_150]